MDETHEMWDEATKMAASLLFVAGRGLRSWPWYDRQLDRIIDTVGRDEMMHEATCEVFRLLHDGRSRHEAYNEAEAYLRGLWRPRFDWTMASYEPRLLPLEATAGCSSRKLYEQEQEEVEVERKLHRVLLHVEANMSLRDWRLVLAYAEHGNLRDAGAVHGVSYVTVKRAVDKARELARNGRV